MNARPARHAAWRFFLVAFALLAAGCSLSGCSLIFDADEYDERTGLDAGTPPPDAGADGATDAAN